MKKNGMTLPEIMITVAIIGIISAILIPMANKAKPDETKIGFLKNYDALTLAVKELVGNTKAFPVCEKITIKDKETKKKYEQTRCYEGFPLLNTMVEGGVSLGNRKFCRKLADQYNVSPYCSIDSPEDGTQRGKKPFSFTTNTGESYRILTYIGELAKGKNVDFISEILIDVNGNGRGTDCMYNVDVTDKNPLCEHPDTFRFWVTADGSIYPGDAASDFYLATRSNVKEKTIVPTGNRFDKENKFGRPDITVDKKYISITDSEPEDYDDDDEKQQ